MLKLRGLRRSLRARAPWAWPTAQCVAYASSSSISYGERSDNLQRQTQEEMQTIDADTRKADTTNCEYTWIPRAQNALSRRQHSVRGFSSMASLPSPPVDLNAYVHHVSTRMQDEELLKELREATHREWPKAEQLIDEPQGKMLQFLVQLTRARDVLEVGCFTGYSALCLVNGLPSTIGSVTTCDVNAETTAFARTYFDRSAKAAQIQSVVSDGKEFLEACAVDKRQFDLIFVDANKRQYINYYNTILKNKLLRDDGLLIFDNTLFRGRVLASVNGEANKKERIARGLAQFNEYISQDERAVCVLLPLWDGLTLVQPQH